MLHRIRLAKTEPRSDDPVDLLLECHERIRAFVALAASLARERAAPAEEIASAAARSLRYFCDALPLHEADEEESVLPRLPASATARTIARDHADVHRILIDLEPLWKRLTEEPAALAAVAPALTEHTSALARRFEAHLALEEGELFPLVRALPEASRAAIADEIRARRFAR